MERLRRTETGATWSGTSVYHRGMENGPASELTTFVLAGGKSTRMGSDKAFLEFEGRTLLARALELAQSIAPNVSIVGSRAKFGAFAPVVEDIFPDRGPLAGIHAALRSSQTDLNLMLAIDMPFVPAEFLRYLVRVAREATAMVTIPLAGDHRQTLCAIYRREFASVAENALRAGSNRIDTLFNNIPVRMIGEQELQRAGFSAAIFGNLNSPADLANAKQSIAQAGPRSAASASPSASGPSVPGQSTRNLAEPAENLQRPYIEFREVSKAFGDKVVLDRVSFNVLPGETVCILGRSGVGKSVSLQLLMGFLKADSGRVIVADQDITNFTEEQMELIRKKVTMVFQNGALFDSLSVGENVAFPLREAGELSEKQIYEIVDGLLKMVGVEQMRDLLPSDLSTGMKRSVAIARALSARPECILYDEPTTMVDPLMAQLLGDLITRLKVQLHLTSIVVTHDMRLAQKLADRVVFLYESKAIFFGTYAEMEKSPEPIIQEFLQLDELKIEAC
jgi:phospholipid/cholesterol/gamma-HCH transport system ATP-binding protein